MNRIKPIMCAVLASLIVTPPPSFAASHREAPITALDHKADITDFFAFVSYEDPTKVTFLLNVDPFLEPGNGPNYFPFDDNVLYTINIDNNNDALAEISFQVQFTTTIKAPGVFTGYVGACRSGNAHRSTSYYRFERRWSGRLELKPDLHRHYDQKRY